MLNKKLWAALLAVFLCFGPLAQAANLAGKDATGSTKYWHAYGTGTNDANAYTQYHLLSYDGVNLATFGALSPTATPAGWLNSITAALYRAAGVTLTDGQVSPLLMNSSGYLLVSPQGTTTVTGTVSLSGTPTVTLGVGSAAFGKLAANDGVDIGDVTINNAVGSGVYIRPGSGVNLDTGNVTIGAAIPAGNNNIGDVDVASLPATPSGTNIIGKVGIDQTTPGTTNKVDIGTNGTVTANIGTVGTLSTAAKQDTGNTSLGSIDTKLTSQATAANQATANSSLSSIDGKTPALGQALAAGSVPVVLTAAQISTLTPLSSVTATISGTPNVAVTNTPSVTISGTPTVTANIGTAGTLATAAKQPALGTAGTASADVLTVQGVASMTPLLTTTTISGTPTVTANAGTNLNTSALALDATLTGGTTKAIARGGAKGSTTAADVTSTASGSNHQPLDVVIYDTSGNAITSFGGGSGGTSSSVGSAVPSTATAAGLSDGTNMQLPRVFDGDSGAGTEYNAGVILRKAASGGSVAFGTSTDPVRTDPTGSTTQPVSGSVNATLQANSGVDIGKLTANQTIDLNKVAGTTTDTNSGVKSAGTIRVVIATDQPALTNKLLVTPDSVALPANQSVNVNQVGGSSLALGQTTKSASVPVTLASDQAPVSDSTLAVSLTSSGTSATSSTLNSIGTGTLILSSLGTGGTVVFEASADGSNWTSVTGVSAAGTSYVSTTSATGTWVFNLAGYNAFRVRATALTSGTIAGTARFSISAASSPSPGLATIVGGGNSVSVASAGADAVSNSTGQLTTRAFGSVYNGTTWDRAASGKTTVQTAATGMQNTIPMGVYNATPPTVADTNNVPLQTNAAGSLRQDQTHINGTAISTGNGTAGAGVQRVAIVSDNTAFSVNAAITAASGSIASGALASGSIAGGAIVDLGAKADAKSTATDTTAVSLISIAKQISASVQAPPSQAVTNATASNFNAQVSGDTAAAASDAGNPVKIGGVGKTALPTAVTDGQRTNVLTDKFGRQVVVGAIRDLTSSQNTTITASTSETTIVTAGAAGVFNDLTSLAITNSSATGTLATLKDATSGTTRGVYYIPATGGIVVTFPVPKVQATAANNWTLTCGTSVSSVYVTAEFIQNK